MRMRKFSLKTLVFSLAENLKTAQKEKQTNKNQNKKDPKTQKHKNQTRSPLVVTCNYNSFQKPLKNTNPPPSEVLHAYVDTD